MKPLLYFARYAAKYGRAFGNHVPLLTSRKSSLMTSRGNSCSMVTNDDEIMVVRLQSMVPPRCAAERRARAEGAIFRTDAVLQRRAESSIIHVGEKKKTCHKKAQVTQTVVSLGHGEANRKLFYILVLFYLLIEPERRIK